MPSEKTFLASERPDLVEKWITTEDNYYGRHSAKNIGEWRKGPACEETVCDAFGNFEFIPARRGSADTVLAKQCFEHLTLDHARPALKECARVLKWGGTLTLDVPDPEQTVELYRQTGDPFYLRHLFGPRQDQFGVHTFYNRRLLTQLAADCGFNIMAELENEHPYPAFTLQFIRS